MKIKELNLTEKEKDVLREIKIPKKIPQIAAILDVTYGTAYTKLVVWEAKGWISKIPKVGKRSAMYHVNQSEVELD